MTPTGRQRLVVIGGGPAGLMAAECAANAGVSVDLYERMGSVGRKFLIAGKGGLNLTHSDALPTFASRFGLRAEEIGDWLQRFDNEALREWAGNLGIRTFVGSSGRVFPEDLKAAPLLRGWVRRLRARGVHFHVHHQWLGWADRQTLRFGTDGKESLVECDAVVLALGGGSWPMLGSDGRWQELLNQRGVDIAPLQASNCGFDVGWTTHLSARHAGSPVKPVVIHWHSADGTSRQRQGEFVLTSTGIEGSLVYSVSAELRDAISAQGSVLIHLDLAPDRDAKRLQRDLSRPRGKHSMAKHLHRYAGIDGVKSALLHELLERQAFDDVERLVAGIKALPVRLRKPRPMEEAISTAGGVRLEELDARLMLKSMPGIFCAGEMLDWEAPTGGYLLTACFASGVIAGSGAAEWLAQCRA
ncbi:TIGR03862 family flavoprotein [Dokdonella sp.]|uniref:TIGR03862 family flavoprotein n=1 Tax=Dokdonella sp. TaxID=2291710 RepID=UPI0035277A3E